MDSEFTLLKKLIQEHGEPLIDELAIVTELNGQGDCYQCRCADYCPGLSCHDAIKMAIKDILNIQEEPDGRNN